MLAADYKKKSIILGFLQFAIFFKKQKGISTTGLKSPCTFGLLFWRFS